MTQSLEEVIAELGLSQYLGVFVDQGFDTWETILDITESDLDALGVKLGHRRKLQRRIANSRGLAPEVSLAPLAQPAEETRTERNKHEAAKVDRPESAAPVVTKRKYRRHPKPDDHAPERPPSAYVLFSNKMREDLKGRNLTFTEIAKLVGENWQNLSAAEKEPFESQAQTAKDRYNQALSEYKKTPEHKKYSLYLQEFKAKRANPSQDDDASKRVKLSEAGGGGRLAGSRSLATRTSRSGTGSGSESQQGSEPPPTRQQRDGSAVSASDAAASYPSSRDEFRHSSAANELPGSRPLDLSPTFGSPGSSHSIPPIRNGSWLDSLRAEQTVSHRQLPSLSDMLDDHARSAGIAASPETIGFPFTSPSSSSPGPPSLISRDSHTSSLRREQSSASSIASSTGHAHTMVDGPLPIHALLVEDSQTYEENLPLCTPDVIPPHPQPQSHRQSGEYPGTSPAYDGHLVNGVRLSLPAAAQLIAASSSHQRDDRPASTSLSKDRGDKPGPSLDGMSALLRAGEIVDSRNKRHYLPVGQAE